MEDIVVKTEDIVMKTEKVKKDASFKNAKEIHRVQLEKAVEGVVKEANLIQPPPAMYGLNSLVWNKKSKPVQILIGKKTVVEL